MTLVHEDYIDENGIDEAKLPNEIKTKISEIEIKLNEFDALEVDKGNKAYDEIMSLSENIKNDLESIKDKKQNEIETETPKFDTDNIGVNIDIELDKLFKSDKTTLTIDQIKSNAPKTYNAIFEEYSDGGENGVITSNYSLIETEEQVYTLKQA